MTVSVVLLCLTVSTVLLLHAFQTTVQNHFGERAMHVAQLAADTQEIKEGLEQNSSTIIQPIAEEIREGTEASYVVIGDMNNIRQSHHDIDKIGEKLGTSSEEALKNEQSIIYKDDGVSGKAMKAKTPIYNESEEVIGVASVGFLTDKIENEFATYRASTLKYYSAALFLGILGTMFVARNIKRTIFGLEPSEISYLFEEKKAILESMNEPIVAVDDQERIVSINKKARAIDHFKESNIGDPITHPQLIQAFENAFSSVEEDYDSTGKLLMDNNIYIMDYSIIKTNGKKLGVVFILRPISEIEELKKEYSTIKTFAEDMRSNNHEFQNKLNTIYGLLKLGKTKRAMHLISKEVEDHQDFIVYLMSSVNSPMIAACLLGKFKRAAEMKIALNIDQESELSELPDDINERELVSALGNIIDNAIEVAYYNRGRDGMVNISFTDLGPDLVFDIEDNGPGVPPEKLDMIYEKGYTTKPSTNSGIGLSIVQNNLTSLDGELYVSESPLGGAHFTIIIPKRSG
ncbi:ATP-binding protein [Salsuginibacillus kocurii]|uniref:ATP-binding protein n=1 Tax=Salsuginibacillus kocurii TaxID=427078 RepID=UPI0012EA08D5|nr:sensor histidine kinase [Salsuginibacillus kocurii]